MGEAGDEATDDEPSGEVQDGDAKPNHALRWIGAFVVVALIGLFWITEGDRGGGGSNDDPPTGETARLMAFDSCKDFVRDRLKAPGTATFRNFFQDDGEVRVTASGDTYTVRSSVDSENSFGASLRSDFTCVVTLGTDRARLVDIDIRER